MRSAGFRCALGARASKKIPVNKGAVGETESNRRDKRNKRNRRNRRDKKDRDNKNNKNNKKKSNKKPLCSQVAFLIPVNKGGGQEKRRVTGKAGVPVSLVFLVFPVFPVLSVLPVFPVFPLGRPAPAGG